MSIRKKRLISFLIVLVMIIGLQGSIFADVVTETEETQHQEETQEPLEEVTEDERKEEAQEEEFVEKETEAEVEESVLKETEEYEEAIDDNDIFETQMQFMPFQAPQDELRFQTDTQVYFLTGKSSNAKNSIQIAWFYEDNLFIASIANNHNHQIVDLTFDNDDLDEALKFKADDVTVGLGHATTKKGGKGSPLYIGDSKAFYVTDFGVEPNEEDFKWRIYNLGQLTLRGKFTLELLTEKGAEGHEVKGEDAIWYVKGSLEIHKEAYDENGNPLNTDKKFKIIVSGPNYSKSVWVKSGEYVLLAGLEDGTYTASEVIDGYSVTINPEAGVTLNSSNPSKSTGKIVVTNTRIGIPVTIEKSVTGNMGDFNQEFEFEYTVIVEGKVFGSDDFTLSHGQDKELKNVPKNAKLILTETDPRGHQVAIRINNDEIKILPDDGENTQFTIDLSKYIDKDKITIKIINHKDVTIDTGITLDTLPYILILSLATVGLGANTVRRRKINKEN